MDCSHDARSHIFSRKVYSKLYGKFCQENVLTQPGTTEYSDENQLGSVFNLDFSPEGDFVVTVRSGHGFVVYDPRQRRKLHCQYCAHDDCVNCVTFLNSYLFATCSDDRTIRLWDFRNLHSSLGILRGHQHWVKNIEYDDTSGFLFSIAFQDGVRFWDINNIEAYSNEVQHRDNRIATLSDPVRMRLAPDRSKMFVSSRKSQCLIINDFDGKKLLNDKFVQELHKHFSLDPQSEIIQEQLMQLTANRPSLHVLCGSRGKQMYRIVMSVTFHPSGEFVGMRHTDVGVRIIDQELTSLFDLRQDLYTPYIGAQDVQHKYLRYVDENSPPNSEDFIKEICYSRDGRILASPYENGIRLLTIDSQCTPPDVYFDNRYQSQHKEDRCPDFEEVLRMPGVHQSPVLTCKFAHHDLILASGALAGTVTFSKPQF